METENQLLHRGVAALNAGDRELARDCFKELLALNPNNADGWVGLSLCVRVREDRQHYLERALACDPNHAYARAALRRVLAGVALPLEPVSPPPIPKDPEKETQNKRQWREVYTGLFLAGLVLVVSLVWLGMFVNQQAQAEQLAALPAGAAGGYVFIDFYADW
jgi:ferric-dicitrate binding protein FerR (iron transport regulator)